MGDKYGFSMDKIVEEPTSVEFTCNGAEKSVQVAGTFNNWKLQELKFNGDCWSCFIPLLPGTYQYKYIVDGVWLHDPSKRWVEGTGEHQQHHHGRVQVGD